MGVAFERLSAELQAAPTDAQLAEELEVDLETLWRWQREVEVASRVSLHQQTDAESGGGFVEELLVDESTEDVEETVNHREEVELLREEILSLKEQERIVLSLYYFEEMKLHEIGSVLGVTESRVSQIHSKALANLRQRLGHLREL